MKRILITGSNSYIGTAFANWLTPFEDEYEVETLDMKSSSWKENDFSLYDTIFHVAGLAHVDVAAVSEETKQKYYRINTELTIETAKVAKASGVKQFIFMSSIIVYGKGSLKGNKKIITAETQPKPDNFYGDSKLQAELGLQKLISEDFKVAIVRPPMIYGLGSKGNYPLLSKLALKAPIFPDVKNERSMLHVDNLCECIRLLVENQKSGVFFPQNSEYVRTSELVFMIRKAHGKKTLLVPGLTWFVGILGHIPGKIGTLTNKAFGNLVYDKKLSSNIGNYQIREFSQSIRLSENINN